MLKPPITAIVLAGGKSTRMQENDKGLQILGDKPLYRHVIARIKPQVEHIIINANRHQAQYAQSGYPVIGDDLPGFWGPLAGICSGLRHCQTELALIVSCDTPFLPDQLVIKLWQALKNHNAVYAYDGEKNHPTILLIKVNQAENIARYLQQGDRKLMLFLQQIGAVRVDFSDQANAFVNINTLAELDDWNRVL